MKKCSNCGKMNLNDAVVADWLVDEFNKNKFDKKKRVVGGNNEKMS